MAISDERAGEDYDEIDVLMDTDVIALGERCRKADRLLHRIATARRGDCGGQEFDDLDDLPEEIEQMWASIHEKSERPCSDLPN